MSPISLPTCNGCGLPLSDRVGDDCPRCGYPLNVSKETQFLESALPILNRVATYGGANITIAQLVQQYRVRLKSLYRSMAMPAEQIIQNIQPFEALIDAQPPIVKDRVPSPVFSEVQPRQTSVLHAQPAPTPVRGPQPAPIRSFSLASFLEEQTITIVASLGAFLILIGSLSFIATTPNLLLSFLVLFVVHAIFGSIGILSYRFRSFRTVAAIYTAIFALLVPLVGFSAYRLVSGNQMQLSTSALVAIAATYAALAYGALAVYQKFSPFGYLAAVALMVATLGAASAFNLGYWWWPSVMMIPALPALFSVPRVSGELRPFVAPWTILREPLLVFMGICVAACAIGIPIVLFTSLLFVLAGEVHFSLVCMACLLLSWNCLFVWRTKRLAQLIPYLFLLCVLMFAYALSFKPIGYVLVLTSVALLYHGLTRFVPQLMHAFKETRVHLEGLALLLVAIVPFIVVPLLPLYLVEKAYGQGFQGLPVSWEIIIGLVAIIAGLALTISTALSHTGLHTVPDAASSRWRWLLLFSSFLLNVAYGLFILLLHGEPAWWLLSLSLALVIAAVATRRLSGAAWANPLDALALIEIVLMLLFSFNLGAGHILGLWLFVATLLYIVVLYQRRASLLFLPALFAALILPILLTRPQVLLIGSIVLPLVAAGIQRLISERWNVSRVNILLAKYMQWEWPLLAIGIFYGIMLSLHDSALSVSTVASWLHVRFPVSLELAALALFWYASAALARVKWWSLIMIGFGVAALLVPGNPFWALAWVAPLLLLLALGISRLAGKNWAAPLYSVAIVAALMMGIAGYNQGQVAADAGVLLLFSALVYLIGVVEQSLIGLWIAPIFATWSIFYSGQIGDLYRSPIVALACAAVGTGIGCLRFLVPVFSDPSWKNRLRRYALPLYATACAAAVLTGGYGELGGVNSPFFAAIPTAMLVYALVAYGVLLFERSARWQWLIVIFAAWGILLLPQAVMCAGTTVFGQACSAQGSSVLYYLTGIVLFAGTMSLLTGFFARRVFHSVNEATPTLLGPRFCWNWSWYLVTFVALVTIVVWSNSVGALLSTTMLLSVLVLLIGFTLLLMLLERAPEMLLAPVLLTIWVIVHTSWPLWQQMLAYSLLCVFVFAAQFVWHVLRPEVFASSPKRLYQGLSIGGQAFVVLVIIVDGGLFGRAGLLVPVGVGSLFVLAMLIFCTGFLEVDNALRRMCNYSAGLLCSLVISWELSAFGLNHIDWLTSSPAVYLVVIAPFLSRSHVLPQRHLWGQICSTLGAALLLLPILWVSFSEGNLAPTLILAGEALGLLLLGITTRIRIFVLCGAALTIVGAMHALFLPSLGIPTSLALAILGITLLAIATGLSLTRRRLRLAWTEWV